MRPSSAPQPPAGEVDDLSGQPAFTRLTARRHLASGSIDTIVAGGEPNELVVKLRRGAPDRLSQPAADALSRASTEELLLELRRRIIRTRERRRETWNDRDGLRAAPLLQ